MGFTASELRKKRAYLNVICGEHNLIVVHATADILLELQTIQREQFLLGMPVVVHKGPAASYGMYT